MCQAPIAPPPPMPATAGDIVGRARPSAAELGRVARRLYRDRWLGGVLQRLRPHICPFEEIIPHVPMGSRVLDVGCGGGLLLGMLAEMGVAGQGVGFDHSARAVRMAGRMAQRADGGERLRFIRSDIADEWPAGHFDVVCIIDVMHHLPLGARPGLLARAAQRVRPGGRVIYKDMTPSSWRSVANRVHDLLVTGGFVRYTPMKTVEGWARDAGLEVIHESRHHRLWYGHELVVFQKPLLTEEQEGGGAAPEIVVRPVLGSAQGAGVGRT